MRPLPSRSLAAILRSRTSSLKPPPLCAALSTNTNNANIIINSNNNTIDLNAYLRESKARIAARPPKLLFDSLSPTNSNLINLALADHLPPAAFARDFSAPAAAPAAAAAGGINSYSPYPSSSSSSESSSSESSSSDLILPQGHHLVYFPIQVPASMLTPDGTDPDHAPGYPFVRRMWAGGSVRFRPGWRDALRLDGRRVVCVETVGEPVVKLGSAGSSGVGGQEKVFVEVRRRYYGGVKDGILSANADGDADGAVMIDETRRLVFMRERRSGKGLGPAQEQTQVPKSRLVRVPSSSSSPPDYSFTLRPDPALLFHFSALTYNAHAIHLDPDYARNQEGYPERLVHGPLTLVLMLSALRGHLRQQASSQTGEEGAYVETIDYRNLRPLFVGGEIRVCVRETTGTTGTTVTSDEDGRGRRKWLLWVEGPDGGLAVRGTATTVTTAAVSTT